MRNLLALIGLAVVGFAGIGWYMGWYKLSFSRSSDGNLEIKTDVNTQKVGADSTEALKNLGAAIGTHVQKAAQEAKSTAPTNAPGGTPGPVTPAQNSTSNSLAPTGAIEPTSSVAPTIPTTPITPPISPSVPGPIKLVPPK